MKDSELKELLLDLAELDLKKGHALENHPAKIAHDRIVTLEAERDEARLLAMSYANATQARRFSEKYGIPLTTTEEQSNG